MADFFEQVLMDAWSNVYREDYVLTSDNFIGYVGPEWRIARYTLKGGKQHGVDLLEIDNGSMTVVLVPTRGMGVLEAFTDDMVMGWESPVKQVVHPAYVQEEAAGGLGWLRGFNEFICRCGLSYHGAPGEDEVATNTGAKATMQLPLHGTIANTPAVRLTVRVQLEPPYELAICGEVCDTRMFGPSFRLLTTVSTVPGSTEFRVEDTVENMADSEAEMELLYHCNYGPPLLGEGARLVAPVKFCCPRDPRAAEGAEGWDTYGPPEPGFAEQCYFARLHANEEGITRVALVDAKATRAATIEWSVEQLPAFTLWKNTAGEHEGYVTGLEPGTDYPNPRKFERYYDRVLKLAGGATYQTDLTFGLVSGADDVHDVEQSIRAMGEGKESDVQDMPDPEYCPM
jgi:hypothetical protein